MSETDALAVAEVSVYFDAFRALHQVNMRVRSGIVTALMGPNGAGKSTLFNAITGVIRPSEGSIRIGRQDVTNLKPHQIAKCGVGRTFQTPRGFPSLSVIDNLAVAQNSVKESFARSLLSNRYPSEILVRAEKLLGTIGLKDRANVAYSRLSSGEARLLEIGRHLMTSPDIFLLDEPTAGVAPELQGRLVELITRLRQEGTTVLLVEHNIAFVRRLADHAIVLDKGVVIAEGTPDEVFANRRVIEGYLGTAEV